jgi:hypothetical protein
VGQAVSEREEPLSAGLFSALCILKRHGVPIRVPPENELQAMPLQQIERIIAWFNDPEHYPRPVCLHRPAAPVAKLVKSK